MPTACARSYMEDLGANRLGLGICRKDGQIHLAYPIAMLVGTKQ